MNSSRDAGWIVLQLVRADNTLLRFTVSAMSDLSASKVA